MDRIQIDKKSYFSPSDHWNPDSWKILVVDDEKAVYDITTRILADLKFSDKPISLFHVPSAKEAMSILKKHPDIAIILMDMMFDTGPDGTELIHWVRRDMKNHMVQIVIRTGHTDAFPELDLLLSLDINGYLKKTQATAQILQSVTISCLRNFLDKRNLHTEIKALKKMEISLKEKETLLQDIVDNIGDILWETDDRLTFKYISRKVEPLTGYTKNDIIHQPFFKSLTKEAQTIAWPRIQKHVLRQEPFSNIEVSRRTRQGDVQYFLVSGKPVFKDNQLTGYRGADIHITELKRFEQEKEKLMSQLRDAQRLEAMGTLAGGIAHDFNNILGGIMGFAQLLQFELKDNPVCKSYTKQIVTGCHRAKNLILQILDFSRQREDHVSGNSLADPVEIASETAKLIRASFPSSIKISLQADEHIGCIKADPSQIHQAVLNLCTNAGQAIENSRGKINIKVTTVSHTTTSPIQHLSNSLPFGNYIKISVSDTGKGIKKQALDKIFNPYFTTKKRGEGTGLGLSVVHGIVTRFNGAVTTQTRPGLGTRFTLYFPEHIETSKPDMKKENHVQKGDAHVLFIDDEPILVDIGKKILERFGYTVAGMESGLDALDLLEKNPDRFDIVITDMTMPDINGTDLAARIKQINAAIPVVMVTGYSNLAHSKHSIPKEIDAVLPKPFDIKSLSQVLANLLKKKK